VQHDLKLSVFQIGAGWFPEFSGGGENVYYHLARYLPAAGVSVRGIVLGSAEVERQSEGSICSFAPRSASLRARLWGARRAVAHAMAAGGCDVVASHFAMFALPVLDLVRTRPLVVHFHGPWAAESGAEGGSRASVFAKAMMERRVYRQAERFVTLSGCFAGILAENYKIDPARITVIPGGVDCARFDLPVLRQAARERLGWANDRKIILAVRRLVRRMGLGELVRSMVEVSQREPDALLLIAGKGPEAGPLAGVVEALGLQDKVKLIGFLPDELLPWAYRAADMTVVPSSTLEGFGLITIESLAAGTPVIVTPVGGLPETVGPLAPQAVLPGCTSANLAEGLTAAVNGTLGLPDAKTCQAYARRHFDWPVIVARIRQVYADAVG
jgi:glycosyltransferase involved in cell wall biosynthesis